MDHGTQAISSHPAGQRPTGSTRTTPSDRLVFVDIARAVSSIAVFYTHIAEQWVHQRGVHAPEIDFVEAFTSVPMHMAQQGIGQIGVPIFFLISGFSVTPIAMRHGGVRFVVNRFFRIFPPLACTVLLTALALSLGINPLSTGQLQTINPLTLLTNSLTINYVIYPQVVLVGVAWTLIIEVIFYLVLVVLLPVLRRCVWLAIAIELTFIFVVLMSRSELGPSWSLFAVNVSYLPAPVIGQVIWARYTRRIPTWLAWLFCSLAWSLYVLADIVDVGRPNTSYNLALAIAVLFFLMGLFAEPKLRPRRLWIALSERAYSLYLMHALVAFVTLDLVSPLVPFEIGLVLAIGTTAAAVELNYRLVERPSHQLGRRLARRRPTRATPPSTVDKPAPVDGQPPAPAEADTTTLPKVGHVPLGIAPERLPAPVPAARPRGPRPLPPETPQGRRPARPPADQSWTPPTRGRMEPGAGDGRLGGQRPRQLHP